jgi:hypothetical protein
MEAKYTISYKVDDMMIIVIKDSGKACQKK